MYGVGPMAWDVSCATAKKPLQAPQRMRRPTNSPPTLTVVLQFGQLTTIWLTVETPVVRMRCQVSAERCSAKYTKSWLHFRVNVRHSLMAVES